MTDGRARLGDRGDVKTELEVAFEEAAFGCEKELTYTRVVACSECRATGSAPGSVARIVRPLTV